jgi:hypothetical protein
VPIGTTSLFGSVRPPATSQSASVPPSTNPPSAFNSSTVPIVNLPTSAPPSTNPQQSRSTNTASHDDTTSSTGQTSSHALYVGLHPTYNFGSDDLVTLDVGLEHHKIVVHKHYITRTSEFFATALKKAWIEGQSRIIELPEETPEHMEYYCDYAYSGKLPTRAFTYRDSDDEMALTFELLASFFVLGERRLDKKLRNAVIHEILRVRNLPLRNSVSTSTSTSTSCNPSTTAVNIIYEGTPEESPARRLMVDLVLAFGKKDEHASDVSSAFSFDVMQGLPGISAVAQFTTHPRDVQAKTYLL